jgi:GNAT superfamily N-acetyltransferase
MKIVPVTPADRDLLASAESVHRQLRPHLPTAYAERMKVILDRGAEMAVALVDGKVAGITVFRMVERTFTGREIYCDDLVTDEAQRSTGVGHALIEYMMDLCRKRACDYFTLDSGCRREQAHKFYFREGMTITSFHFTRQVNPGVASISDRVKV